MTKKTINLNGPDGNAWALLSYGQSVCEQIGKPWEPIQTEMMSGDYENMVKVFKKNFRGYFRVVGK